MGEGPEESEVSVPGGVPWDRGTAALLGIQEAALAGDAEALDTLRWKLRMTDLSFRGVWLIYAGRVLRMDQRCEVGRRP